jgi:hypothetical protein
MVALPAAAVRAIAREHRISTTALLLTLVGEAWHRMDPAGTATRERLRTMVPRTTHALRRADPGSHAYQGNHTAALAVDLPVGPMPLAWRLAAVAAALTKQEHADQPVAAQTVMRTLGCLPAPLQAMLVRAIYGHRFFTLITSVLPGPRKVHYAWNIRVMSVFPVLPLAEGVGLAVGFLTWKDMIGVGITTDIGLVSGSARFADALRRAFDDLAGDLAGNLADNLAADPRGTPGTPETARE